VHRRNAAVRVLLGPAVGLLVGSIGIARAEHAFHPPNVATGLVLGLNVSEVSGRYYSDDAWREASPAPGYRFGLSFRVPRESAVAFDTGILIDRKGSKWGNETLALTYLTLPATLELGLGSRGRFRPYAKADAEGGILVSSTIQARGSLPSHKDYGPFDLALLAGGGIALPLGGAIGTIEIAYIHGVHDIIGSSFHTECPPERCGMSGPWGGGWPIHRHNRMIAVAAGIRGGGSKRHATGPTVTRDLGARSLEVRPRIGIEIGLNAASVSGCWEFRPSLYGPAKPAFRSGARVGIQVDVPQGVILSIATGIYLDRRGSRWDRGGEQAARLTLDYVEIPLNLRFRFSPSRGEGPFPYLKVGPELGILLGARTISWGSAAGDVSVKGLTQTFDLGFSVGGGFDFPFARRVAFTELDYTQGFRNTYATPICPDCTGPRISDSKSRVFRLSGGVRI